jgi:glycosyltransferase involved in cell wall biosynthesis
VNGASDEIDVPLAASVQWLLDQPTWRFFDVAHLHSVELVEYRQLEQLVERLRGARKRLIVTVHDVVPNIEQDQPEFLRKTRLVLSEADGASTLTPWAQQLLIARLGVHAGRVEVLPHGYVVSPGLRHAEEPRLSRGPCLGVHGALRPNRCVDAVVDMWRYLLDAPSFRGTLRLLLRSISGEDVGRYASTLTKIMGLLRDDLSSDVRLMSGVATDADIVRFCRGSSAVFLPYRWVSHSGQLELAYDLGVPVIAPELGGLPSQAALHLGESSPIHWFDPGLLSGGTGLRALASTVRELLLSRPESSLERRLTVDYRLEEHAEMLERYDVLYHAERN